MRALGAAPRASTTCIVPRAKWAQRAELQVKYPELPQTGVNLIRLAVQCTYMAQVSISIPDGELRELEKLRDQTGLPVARLIDLQRRGYEVRAIKHD